MEAETRTGLTPTVHPPQAAGRGWRTLLIVLGGVSLLTGLDAALVRLGVWAPVESARLGDLHGPIMVLGFMGTLISLERAQALRNKLAYLAPTLLGAGSLLLIAGAPQSLGKLVMFEGALAFVLVMVALWVRAPLALVAAQTLGALLAFVAAGLWLIAPDISPVITLLAGFLVITIASERAELAQLTMGARAVPTLLAGAVVIALSSSLAVIWPLAFGRVFGLTLLFTALWLLRDDVGRRMIRTNGLRRFNAAALLAGNFWLAVAGTVWLVVGQPVSRGTYDLSIHGFFLGFGMSMIMAHAPIIFPTVLGRALPYRPSMCVPLGLLHGGLAVRAIGDLGGPGALWRVGGVLTVVSVLLFALTALASAVRA